MGGMAEVTPAHVLGLWEAMSARWRTTWVPKASAAEMRVAGWFLDRIGVLDRDDFRDRFTTVIGRRIYVPFHPGTPTNTHGLWSQLVVCVHEHQHVVQLEREGTARFAHRYLARRDARAAFEAEAYACGIELDHWRFGRFPSPERLAAHLRSYGVRDVDIAAAESTLEAAVGIVSSGGTATEAGRFALDWMELHAPELRHRPSGVGAGGAGAG